jgi:hypothetical protein
MRSWLAWLPLLAVSVTACDEEPAGPLQPFSGAWVWVRSEGGIAGQVRTPQTEGISVLLDFDGRQVRAFRSGELVDAASYTAIELPTAGPIPVYELRYSPPIEVLPFDAMDTHTVRRSGQAGAQFADPCCDRWVHTFTEASFD